MSWERSARLAEVGDVLVTQGKLTEARLLRPTPTRAMGESWRRHEGVRRRIVGVFDASTSPAKE
jgi:hypothetical protein